MTTNIGFLSLITIIAAAHGLFIAIYLWLKGRGNKKANRYLALILLGLSFQLYDNFMLLSGLFEQFPHFVLISYPFTLVYAPALFAFVKCVTRPNASNFSTKIFHFIPAILHLLYGLSTFHFHSAPFKINYILHFLTIFQKDAPEQASIVLPLFNIAIIIQFVIYITVSIIEIKAYQTRSKNINSFSSPKSLKWIIYVMGGVFLLFIFSSFNLTLSLSNITPHESLGYIPLIIVSIYIYYISFFIVNNPEILARQVSLKYEKSSLSSGEKEKIICLLEKYLENKKPYYNSNLTISILAKSLDVQPKYLSQVINENYHQNFYEFINFHRIMEAKELLLNKKFDYYSIFGVGLQVGFNSKSSFNAAFKKFTGVTPLKFKKNR
jgi:AraC-like DNA-binding protein